MKKLLLSIMAICLICSNLFAQNQSNNEYQSYLHSFYEHINSDKLMGYIEEMSKEEYKGRLVGTESMQKVTNWGVSLFEKWDIAPFGTDGYIQAFPYPISEVSDAEVKIHIAVGNNKKEQEYITKTYPWGEWYAGNLSGNGEVTAEVVYAGYGVIAPELGYNDYEGIDVKGKIVLIEGETPNTSREDDDLTKWYYHTLHQTKHKNAVEQGAVGMLYKWVCGPNSSYDEDFIYCHISDSIASDIFKGTGKSFNETRTLIKETLKPQSFNTGKKATIRVESTYLPDAQGRNILGIIEGTDSKLKDEYIIVGAHIDHLGMLPHLIAGANDNASATAALLGVAEAIKKGGIKTKRSIIFMHIDAEEANLGGSTYYCNNPIVPKEKIKAVINLESVGVGSSFSVSAGVETPWLNDVFAEVNEEFIGRKLYTSLDKHLTRPRTDGAVFMKSGYPTINIFSRGVGPDGKRYYHHPGDNIDQITPDLLFDATKLAYLSVIRIGNM